jgi:Phenol hydroxylase subunit.
MQNPIRSRALITTTEQQAFVRFQRRTPQGFIEFLFGVGSSDLMVELVLPEAAYHEFCAINNVIRLTRQEEDAQDLELQKWKFGAPGIAE